MSKVKVDLVCRSQKIKAAEIEVQVPATLDAVTVVSGLRDVDGRYVPAANMIQDGVQMVCRDCRSPLYFRTGSGEFAAMPGSIRIEG